MTTSFPDLPDVPDAEVLQADGDPSGTDVPSDLPDADAELDSTAQGPIEPEQALPGGSATSSGVADR